MLRLRAKVQARRGFLDGAAFLNQLGIPEHLSLWLVTEYVFLFLFLFRFWGLTVGPEICPWIQRGRQLLDGPHLGMSDPGAALREHEAYLLMLQGRLTEAAAVLEEVCGRWRVTRQNPRDLYRALALLGEVYRRSGQWVKSRRTLDEAAERQTRYGIRAISQTSLLPTWKNWRRIGRRPVRSWPRRSGSKLNSAIAWGRPELCYWKRASRPTATKRPPSSSGCSN